jgi:apolipoprotein D and lipocalin family protein
MLMSGCTGLPEGVSPVDGFDINKYMGKWYEIARLDHSFERNKHEVTAEKEWDEAEGKAYFVEGVDEGYLKVSFFGPFYGTYVVFELDKESYQYAFVSGPDKSYLWLLARTPTVDDELISQFVEKSKTLGFNTDELIFTRHGQYGKQ